MRLQLIATATLAAACTPPSDGVRFVSTNGEATGLSADGGGTGADGGGTGADSNSGPNSAGSSGGSNTAPGSNSNSATMTGAVDGSGGGSSSSGAPILPVTQVDWTFGTRTYGDGSIPGMFAPAYITAVWVTTQGGQLVQTLYRMGDIEYPHLVAWSNQTGESLVDAFTGASFDNHTNPPHSGTWDLTDMNDNPVPDPGDYTIWIEFTEENSLGMNMMGTCCDPGPVLSYDFSLSAGHFMWAPPDNQFWYGVVVHGHD